MAANINTVVVSGNLTRDPETRDVGQTTITNFGIAVNERTKINGEWGERANFFRCSAWGAMGENIAKYLSKGSGCVIQGRLRWSSWEKEGVKRDAVEIVVENCQFYPKGSGGGNNDSAQRAAEDFATDTADLPPAEPTKQSADTYDDIPF